MAKYSSFGAVLSYDSGSSVFIGIAGVKDITGPGFSSETIDVTTHASPNQSRQFLKGLKDAGELTFDLEFDPADVAGQKILQDDYDAGTSRIYKLTFNCGRAAVSGGIDPYTTFSAYVIGFNVANPVAGSITASITLKLSGAPVIDHGS